MTTAGMRSLMQVSHFNIKCGFLNGYLTRIFRFALLWAEVCGEGEGRDSLRRNSKMSAADTLYFLIAENRVFRSNVQSVSKYAIFDFVILLIVWQITLFLNFLSPKTGCSARGIKYVFLTKQAAFFYRTHTVRLLHPYGLPTSSVRYNQQ